MDNLVVTVVAAGSMATLAAAVLGFYLEKGCGAILFGVAALLAFALCTAGAAVAGWVGLLVTLPIIGTLGAGLGFKLGKKRARELVIKLWIFFAISCIIGYYIAGGAGVLAIALPSNLVFWALLYVLADGLLPLNSPDERPRAFRSLLTYSLGGNYPYYIMKDRKLELRVEGNAYKSFFAGPGIIITDCDHLVVTTDGLNIRVPDKPGLMFTEKYELVERPIDLRPQLRSFHVEARTADGIDVRVLTFIPFRIYRKDDTITLGKGFPFDSDAVFQAVTREYVERKDKRKHNWDELVEIQTNRILREIIATLKFDDLCLALGPCAESRGPIMLRYARDALPFEHNPAEDPRYRIRDELVNRLKKEMQKYGIEVVGGGISNLLPVNKQLTQQRTANWRIKWQNRIKNVEAARDRTRVQIVDQSRVGVDQALLLSVAELLTASIDRGEDISDEVVAASLVASLERMAENPNISDLVSHDTRQKISFLRGIGRPIALPGHGTLEEHQDHV